MHPLCALLCRDIRLPQALSYYWALQGSSGPFAALHEHGECLDCKQSMDPDLALGRQTVCMRRRWMGSGRSLA